MLERLQVADADHLLLKRRRPVDMERQHPHAGALVALYEHAAVEDGQDLAAVVVLPDLVNLLAAWSAGERRKAAGSQPVLPDLVVLLAVADAPQLLLVEP